jgi:hypothetical protein
MTVLAGSTSPYKLVMPRSHFSSYGITCVFCAPQAVAGVAIPADGRLPGSLRAPSARPRAARRAGDGAMSLAAMHLLYTAFRKAASLSHKEREGYGVLSPTTFPQSGLCKL